MRFVFNFGQERRLLEVEISLCSYNSIQLIMLSFLKDRFHRSVSNG